MIGYLNFQSLGIRKCKRNPLWCVGRLSLKGIPGVVTNWSFQTEVKECMNNTSAKCTKFYIMNFNQRIIPCIIPTGYDNICIPSKILRHSPLFQFPLELGSNCNVDRIQDVCDRPTFPSLWSLDISIFWQMTKGWRESIQREQSCSQGCFWSDTRDDKITSSLRTCEFATDRDGDLIFAKLATLTRVLIVWKKIISKAKNLTRGYYQVDLPPKSPKSFDRCQISHFDTCAHCS